MKKSIYRTFIFLAIPIVFQQLLSQSLVFVDQFMIGKFGDDVVGAVMTAGQVSFFYGVTQFGILSAGSIFIAQYHGKAEHQMVRRIFGFMTGCALVFALVTTVGVLFWSHALFSLIFPGNSEKIALATEYSKVIVLSFIFSTISVSIATGMRSIERTREPVIASSVAIVANILLNLLLIPHYGAIGSAYGTFLARIIEVLLIVVMFQCTENPFKNGRLKDYWISNKALLKTIIVISIPVIFTEFIWALATTIINLLYTQTGKEGTAASGISGLVIQLQSIILMGFASATAIIIGKVIGEEGRDAVKKVASKLTKLAFVTALILIVCSYAFGIPFIMSMYHFDTAVTEQVTYTSLLVVTGMSFFKLMNWYLFIGIFRAGGDTRFAFYADVSFLIFYAIPVVLIGLYVFHLPVYILILLAMLEEVFKIFLGIWRYLSGKWIHDVTRDIYHV